MFCFISGHPAWDSDLQHLNAVLNLYEIISFSSVAIIHSAEGHARLSTKIDSSVTAPITFDNSFDIVCQVDIKIKYIVIHTMINDLSVSDFKFTRLIIAFVAFGSYVFRVDDSILDIEYIAKNTFDRDNLISQEIIHYVISQYRDLFHSLRCLMVQLDKRSLPDQLLFNRFVNEGDRHLSLIFVSCRIKDSFFTEVEMLIDIMISLFIFEHTI